MTRNGADEGSVLSNSYRASLSPLTAELRISADKGVRRTNW